MEVELIVKLNICQVCFHIVCVYYINSDCHHVTLNLLNDLIHLGKKSKNGANLKPDKFGYFFHYTIYCNTGICADFKCSEVKAKCFFFCVMSYLRS